METTDRNTTHPTMTFAPTSLTVTLLRCRPSPSFLLHIPPPSPCCLLQQKATIVVQECKSSSCASSPGLLHWRTFAARKTRVLWAATRTRSRVVACCSTPALTSLFIRGWIRSPDLAFFFEHFLSPHVSCSHARTPWLNCETSGTRRPLTLREHNFTTSPPHSSGPRFATALF